MSTPSEPPLLAQPGPQTGRRSPMSFARQFGEVVKAGVLILAWVVIAAGALAVAFVAGLALLWVVQLAWKALGT